MRKSLISLLSILVIGAAIAQPGRGDGPNGKSGRWEKCEGMEHKGMWVMMLLEKGKEELGLSDDQAGKIKVMVTEHKKRMIKLDSDLKLAQVDLKGVLDAEKVTKAAIDKQCDKISGIENQLAKERLYVWVDAMDVLTKEQQEKVRAMKPGFGKGMHKRDMNCEGKNRECPKK